MQARAHYNILWILTVEENAGKAVVENLALSWALLLRPLLLGVTLLESSRVNLIKVGQAASSFANFVKKVSLEYLEYAGGPHLHSDAPEAA